jgi:pimeloyl-ACP methyl ester carboxylesterase
VTLFLGYSTFKYYPEDVRFQAMEMMSQKKMFDTFQREIMNFDISGNQVLRAGRIPDVPLVVITRGKRAWPEDPYGDALEASWLEMQKELAELTSSGRQVIAANSRHMIHLEQPDLVASIIMSVVKEVRQGIADKTMMQ